MANRFDNLSVGLTLRTDFPFARSDLGYVTRIVNGAMNERDKVNILLVDDRPDNLLTLETILSPLQENLITAQSGKEALRLALHHEFAVILLDINMPEMDGFEVASLIRQRESTQDIPIIFISAMEPSDERVKRAYSLRAVDYLPSPSSPEVLRAKVSVFADLHRKNKRLQKMTDELHTRNQQLQTFCYAMAHDLRAPLRAIKAFSKIVLEEHLQRLDEEGKDLLQRISVSATRMDDLTLDLLDFIRIENVDLPIQVVEFEDVLTEAFNFLRDEIGNTSTRFTIQRPLPKVCGHKETLVHVLINLVSNAMTFMAEGKTPEIQIASEARDGVVRVMVHDNGVGIDAHLQQKIFGLFERLEPTKHLEGTGLGLAIVKTSIERMNGKVGVESHPGKGSTFWFELPRP